MKITKKLMVMMVCLSIAFTVLSGCVGSEKKSEVTTSSEKTMENLTESFSEVNGQETMLIEEVSDEPVENVIIPLYRDEKDAEIHQLLDSHPHMDDPTNLDRFTDFCNYFDVVSTEKTVSSDGEICDVYELEKGASFNFIAPPEEGSEKTEIKLGLYEGLVHDTEIILVPENGAFEKFKYFIPIWFNETQGCLVGYKVVIEDGIISYEMEEIHYSSRKLIFEIEPFSGDMADYGF